jgi:hypothetical protein
MHSQVQFTYEFQDKEKCLLNTKACVSDADITHGATLGSHKMCNIGVLLLFTLHPSTESWKDGVQTSRSLSKQNRM